MNFIKIYKSKIKMRIKKALYFLFSKVYALQARKYIKINSQDDQKLILFFILPGFKQYILNLILVANAVRFSGKKVVFVYCDRVIDFCLWSLSHDFNENYCQECSFRSYGLIKESGFEMLKLSHYLSFEDRQFVKNRIEDCKNLNEFEIDGKKIGDLALIDLTLTRKLESFSNLSAEDFEISKKFILSCSLIYLASKKLLQSFNVEQVVYNGEYSTSLAVGLAARILKKRVVNISTLSHKVADNSRVFLFGDLWEQALFKNFERWSEWRDLPAPGLDVREAYEDLLARLNPASGKMVYSPQMSRHGSIREDFRVGDRKFIVAFTSSEDEALSTKKALDVFDVKAPYFEQPFKDQMSWIKFLTEYAESHPEYFIALRVHPRAGVNRFEKIESEHSRQLRKILETVKLDNFKVIWPEEAISSYGLGFESDLVLISWSNIGMEFARSGVPVLASMVRISSIPFDDFVVRVKSIPDYVQAIGDLIARKRNYMSLVRAHRWYSVSKFKSSVFLSKKMFNMQAISNSEMVKIQPEAAPEIALFFNSNLSLPDVYLEKYKNIKKSINREEIEAHLSGLMIVFHFLMTGKELSYSQANSVPRNAINFDGISLSYAYDGEYYRSNFPALIGIVDFMNQLHELELNH